MKLMLVFTLSLLALGAQASDYVKIRVQASELKLHDGDTVRYTLKAKDGITQDGKPIIGSRSLRLVGYDTPELQAPGIGMLFDQPYAREAARFADSFIAKGKAVYLHVISTEESKGRLLAEIEVDGEFLGAALVKNGLAYETVSAFPLEKDFPEKLRLRLQNSIIAAWFESPIFAEMEKGRPLRFLDPYAWRKINMHAGLTYNQQQWERLSRSEKADLFRRACENSENNAAIQLPRHEARWADDNNQRNFVTFRGQRRRARFPADLHRTEYRNEVCH